MCGFVAAMAASGQPIDPLRIDDATRQIAHRGPDDCGFFTDHPMAFGFRRLSIFDLSDLAHQPMASADGRHVIVFNGAIYNWVELRRELESLGHVFSTHGDTEVLLHAWRQWGEGCLARLNGMFAFLVWDRTERTLHGARDRFGVKPLYWCEHRGTLLFASEIKALRTMLGQSGSSGLDTTTVADFLENGCLDAREETFYQGIRRVPAGTAFRVRPGQPVRWHKWWSLEAAAASSPVPGDPAVTFAELFEDAVRLRMRGDVPVGVLLSGGLDSTSIICAMARASAPGRKPRAFGFISPDSRHDETAALQSTLAQTGAEFERISPEPRELLDALERHLWFHDEPVYSLSSLVSERLVAASRRAGVKILLNGQGADEVLAGYPSYFGIYWSSLLRRGRFAGALSGMRAFAGVHPQPLSQHNRRYAFHDALGRLAQRVPGARGLMSLRRGNTGLNDWLEPALQGQAAALRRAGSPSLSSALQSSVEVCDLPIYLRQEDRNAMAHGVEARLPFLDHRLVTLAFALGDEWKISGARGKHLLREAMRGRIPENIRTEPRKMGFPTPLDDWFRGPLREPMVDLLGSREFRECGFFRVQRVREAFEQHQSGRMSFGPRLFDVAQTIVWLRAMGRPAAVEALYSRRRSEP